MKGGSGRSIRGLVILIVVASLVSLGSIYLGNATLAHHIIALSFVCVTCYVVYEYIVVKLLYFQIHRRHTRAVPDSPDLRKQVRNDIGLYERRAGMVVFVMLLVFAGSIIRGFIGITASVVFALAIIVYARKTRII
jgi:hypothetical protein